MKKGIDMIETGKHMKAIREKCKMPIAYVAGLLNLYVQAVYRWEYGQTCPTIDNLINLSEIFGVPMKDLIVRPGCHAHEVGVNPITDASRFTLMGISTEGTSRKLRALREKADLGVYDVAAAMSVYPASVYQWENGKNVPTVDNLVLLEPVYGVSIDDMVVTR